MTVSTFYPDAGTGGTTVDGNLARDTAGTYSEVRDGAGTSHLDADPLDWFYGTEATGTTDEFQRIRRSIYTFDTSTIGSDSISVATFSLNFTIKQNGLGDEDCYLVESTPASNNDLVNADYGQLGSTSFGSVAYGSISTSAYTDITLNASGISNINKSGISKFGIRGEWDLNDSFGGSWASWTNSRLYGNFADETGTTSDPKLTVTHAAAATFIPRVSSIF